jgi:hypothetical protein
VSYSLSFLLVFIPSVPPRLSSSFFSSYTVFTTLPSFPVDLFRRAYLIFVETSCTVSHSNTSTDSLCTRNSPLLSFSSWLPGHHSPASKKVSPPSNQGSILTNLTAPNTRHTVIARPWRAGGWPGTGQHTRLVATQPAEGDGGPPG